MNSSTQWLSWRNLLSFAWAGLTLSIQLALADGGIATDGTMGAAQALNGTNIIIPQNLGMTVGANLFHSFSEFNIANGQTVEYTGSNALHNVISRVTGSDVTEIEGTLKSGIANAAFYFINPNGVTFGSGAQVDVPGAFHVGTADKIDFPNNGVFYADSNRTSSLSSESPDAFGFLDTSQANNGLINIDGAQLGVKTGQTLDMVAGVIELENNAAITAQSGEIRLVALQGNESVDLQRNADGNLPLPNNKPSANNAGNLIVNASAIDTTGNGGGRVALWSGTTSFTNSTVFADNDGFKDAATRKGVDIRSYSLDVDNSLVTFDALATGKAGQVKVEISDTLAIVDEGIIGSSTYAQGDAGSVSVLADTLTIDSLEFSIFATGIISQAEWFSRGQAGNVSIQAGTLNVLNGAQISSSTFSQGNGGDVSVTADILNLRNTGGIFSQTSHIGQGGNVNIRAGTLNLINGGAISSSTFSRGNAGTVIIDAEALNILNGGRISSSTFFQGNAGSVNVTADTLRINTQGSLFGTGIFSQSVRGSGQADTITVRAGRLDIFNGGEIASSTFTEGNAGSVSVTADTLTINSLDFLSGRTGIFSQANEESSGNAGDVNISATTLAILNGGQVSSSTFAQGNADTVSVNAETLTINGSGFSSWETGIFSKAESGSSGHAGNVTVNAETVKLNNLAGIASDTYSTGSAGTVSVNAETVTILGGSHISSASIGADSSGLTGDVIVAAGKRLNVSDGGRISIENQANLPASEAASLQPGAITVTAPDIDIKDSEITSHSFGNVAAGNIVLNFSHCLNMDSSFINTSANTGNGGAITINGGELGLLHNSGFTTTVTGENSNGGDISTTADIMLIDSGLIQANAVGGSGGHIMLNLKALIPSGTTLILGGAPATWQPSIFGFNVIQAASQVGVSGTVNVSAPQLNLSGVLANLGGPQFATGNIADDYCGMGAGSSLTRKGAGGLKPKSADLYY